MGWRGAPGAPGVTAPDPASYVFVDWGREFAAQHSLACPELAAPYVEAGQLHRVAGAPEFLCPADAVYAGNADPTVSRPSPLDLRHAARAPQSVP